jgi:hypothetical protein
MRTDPKDKHKIRRDGIGRFLEESEILVCWKLSCGMPIGAFAVPLSHSRILGVGDGRC